MALAGDLAAFEELAERHRGPALSLAWRLMGDRDDAEDVAQDALVAAFADLPALRKPERFAAWLASIIRARCAERGRRLARAATPAWHDGAANTVPDPADLVVVRDAVRRALAQLSDAGRVALLCYHVDGLTCREIGEYLGASEGATRVRLHRARNDFREAMTDERTPEAPRAPGATTPVRHLSMEVGEAVADMQVAGARTLRTSDAWFVHWGKPLAQDPFCGEGARELYLALYPRCSWASRPWADAGIPEDRAGQALAQFEPMEMVRRDGDDVICLVPVLGEEEGAILRPWLDTMGRIAADVARGASARIGNAIRELADERHLPTLRYVAASQVFGLGPYSRWLGGSVMAGAPRGPAAEHCMCYVLHGAMRETGNFGGRGRQQGADQLFVGHGCGRWPLFDEPLRRWEQGVPPIRVADVLFAIADETVAEREALAAVGGAGFARADRMAVLDDLVRIHLIERRDGGYALAFPVLQAGALGPLIALCDGISETLQEHVADTMDQYYELVRQCSFRDCRAADAAGATFAAAGHAQWLGVVESGLLGEVPAEADGSYGVWMILADG